MKSSLCRKNYDPNIVFKKSKISFSRRDNLLKYKQTKRLTCTPLILEYDKNMPTINNLLRNLANKHLRNDTIEQIGGLPTTAFTVRPSIGKTIIRAKYPTALVKYKSV